MVDITDGAKIVVLAEALVRLHDAISEIVEEEDLKEVVQEDEYHELIEALAQSIAALNKAGVQ